MSLVTTYGRGKNSTKHLKNCSRLKEWYATHQKWTWMGRGNIVMNEAGKRYELLDGSYKQSSNVVDGEMLPVKVTTSRNTIVRVLRNHNEAGHHMCTVTSHDSKYKRLIGQP